VRRSLALAACLLLAACGSSGEEQGTASLWITRDRGATVLHQTEVAAGQTVLQALRLTAKVDTRYGGRFVQAIDGLEGSAAGGRDWFYFVNGVAADRSAAEYRLRSGEIAWWDFRRWADTPEVQVVVGAFPEPFLHGYDGEIRPVAVRYEAGLRADAEAVGRLLGAASIEPAAVPAPAGANVFRLVRGPTRFAASAASPAGPYTFVLAGRPGDGGRLAVDPDRYRLRFEVGP
jgi:hypothetical protein